MKTRNRLISFIVIVAFLYQDILLAQGCLSPRYGLEDLEGPLQFRAQVYLGFRQVAERGLDKLDPKYEEYIRFREDSIVNLSEDGNPFFTIDVELIQANILLTVVFYDPYRPPFRYLKRIGQDEQYAREMGFWIVSKKERVEHKGTISIRLRYIGYHAKKWAYILWNRYGLFRIASVGLKGIVLFFKMAFSKRFRYDYISKMLKKVLVKGLGDQEIDISEIDELRKEKSDKAISSFTFLITLIVMNEFVTAPLAGAFVLALPIPIFIKIPLLLISGGSIRAFGMLIAKFFIYPELHISRAIVVTLPKWIGIPWSLNHIMRSYNYNFYSVIERNRRERFRRLLDEIRGQDDKSAIKALSRYGSAAKCVRLLQEMGGYEDLIRLIKDNSVSLVVDFGVEKISAGLLDDNFRSRCDIIRQDVKKSYSMEDVDRARRFIIERLRMIINTAVHVANEKGVIVDDVIITMEGLTSYRTGSIDYSTRFRAIEMVGFRELVDDIVKDSGIQERRLYFIREGHAAVLGERYFGAHREGVLFYLGLNTSLRTARIDRDGNVVSQVEFGYLYKVKVGNREFRLNDIAGRRNLVNLAMRLGNPPEEKVYEVSAQAVGDAIVMALMDGTIKDTDLIVIGGDLEKYGLVSDELKGIFIDNIRRVVARSFPQVVESIVVSNMDNDREMKGAKYYARNKIEYELGIQTALSGGASKDIGPPMEVKIPKVLKQRWLEKAKGVNLKVYIPGDSNISAKVFQVDDLPRGLNAWHFRDGDGTLVIVTRAPPTDEIIYHEYREDYWMRKELSQRDSHIIASAEQVLAFSEDGRLTPYHKSQLENITTENLEKIIDEARDYHHQIIKKYLGQQILERIEIYESLLVSKLWLRRVEEMLRWDSSGWLKPEKIVAEYFKADSQRKREIEEIVIRAMEHKNHHVRIFAAEIIAGINLKRAKIPLVNALSKYIKLPKDESGFEDMVINFAIRTLCVIGDQEVIDVLLECCSRRESAMEAAVALRKIDIDWDEYLEKKEEVVGVLKKYNEPNLRFTEIYIRGHEYWKGLREDEKIAYLKGVTGDLRYLIYVLLNYLDSKQMHVWIKRLWRAGKKEDLKELLDVISPEEYQRLGEEVLELVKSEYDFEKRYIDSFVFEEERAGSVYFTRLYNLLREFRAISDGIPLVIVYNDSFNLPFELLSNEERENLGLVIMDEEELRDTLASEDARGKVRGKVIAVKMVYPERKEKKLLGRGIFYEDTDAFFNKLRDIFRFCSVVLVDKDDEFKISVLQRKLRKSLSEEVTGRNYEFSERTNFRDKRFGDKKIAVPQWFFVNFLETAFLSNRAKRAKEASKYWRSGVLTINRKGGLVNLNDFLKEKILRAICRDIREKLIFWPDFTTDESTNWLLRIPNYLRLEEMSTSLRGFLLNPQKDFLRKNINIVYGRDVAEQEIQNIYITHYQDGAYQIILRVTVQLINGEQRDFGMVLARDGQEKSDLTNKDFYNLGELYARDSRFVPRPYILDEISIKGEDRAIFSVEWLSEYKELGYEQGFSVNSWGENQHFSEEESNRIKEGMIRILAAYYDPEKRKMIDKVEINSGDFVYNMEDGKGDNIKLITVRNLKESVSPEEFIDYIVNYEMPFSLFFVFRFLDRDNINNLINGLIKAKGLETTIEWLIAYRDAVVAGRLKENKRNGLKQFDDAIESLSQKKPYSAVEDTVKKSRELAGEWSKLGGVAQRIKGIDILQFAVPIGVLKSAGDFTLALKKMGLLGRGDTIFEVIIYDLENELDGDKFIKALDLPRNIRVYGITKAQAGDIKSLRGFIENRYPLKAGGYLMIATDLVNREAAEAEADNLVTSLEEKVSLRVIVRPDESSVISLSNILSSWLEDLDSSVKIILPLPISPQELKRRLEEEMLYLWEFLVST